MTELTSSTNRKITDSYSAANDFQSSSLKKSSVNTSDSKVLSSYNETGKMESYKSVERKESYNENGLGKYSFSNSSYSGKSGYSSNGYPDTTLSFPNGVGRTLSGAYKTNDVRPPSPPRESAHTYSPPLTSGRAYSYQKTESSGKISLGSLK